MRSAAQTPVKSGPSSGRAWAVTPGVGERGDDRALHRSHVGDDVVDAHDRVADELARTVVGHAPAAVGVDDVDALAEVPGLTHRQLARPGAPAAGVDGRVFEQQERVGDRAGLTRRAHALLERERRAVLDDRQPADPELVRGHLLMMAHRSNAQRTLPIDCPRQFGGSSRHVFCTSPVVP